MDELASSVIRYCADIGRDSLLVQGAGGNVSWKENDTLWVKASGTWLADAARDDIFVAVDLGDLRQAMRQGNFSVKPQLAPAANSNANAKPSIETLLHALMPHKVVVHLHAIDILAYLVRGNCEATLKTLLGDSLSWVLIDYFKPGAEMAAAVHRALATRDDAQVVLLKNHGVVIGAEDINAVQRILQTLIDILRAANKGDCSTVANPPLLDTPVAGYRPIDDDEMHRLACDAELFSRLKTDWALYPDHVVFLGAQAHLYEAWNELQTIATAGGPLPELIFIRNKGVFVTETFNTAKHAQLRCYYDVLVRQPQGAMLEPISPEQVADLLNREDEKYRQNISRSNSD